MDWSAVLRRSSCSWTNCIAPTCFEDSVAFACPLLKFPLIMHPTCSCSLYLVRDIVVLLDLIQAKSGTGLVCAGFKVGTGSSLTDEGCKFNCCFKETVSVGKCYDSLLRTQFEHKKNIMLAIKQLNEFRMQSNKLIIVQVAGNELKYLYSLG